MPKSTAPVVAAGGLRGRAQPCLVVDELTLRPWDIDDVPALVEAYDDPEIRHWHARSMTRFEAAQYVTSANAAWLGETAANWAVTDSGHVVGRMSLRAVVLADGWAEVGYWVLPAARGRGVAPRALRTVTHWAVDVGLHRVELAHSTHNPSSCRVADKAGYVLEGTKRSQALHDDGWHDMHLHAFVAGDR